MSSPTDPATDPNLQADQPTGPEDASARLRTSSADERGQGVAAFQRGRIQWGRMPASEFRVGALPAASNRLHDAMPPQGAPTRAEGTPVSSVRPSVQQQPRGQRQASPGFFSGSMIPHAAPAAAPRSRQSQQQRQSGPASAMPAPSDTLSPLTFPEPPAGLAPTVAAEPEGKVTAVQESATAQAVPLADDDVHQAPRKVRRHRASKTPIYAAAAVSVIAAAGTTAWVFWPRPAPAPVLAATAPPAEAPVVNAPAPAAPAPVVEAAPAGPAADSAATPVSGPSPRVKPDARVRGVTPVVPAAASARPRAVAANPPAARQPTPRASSPASAPPPVIVVQPLAAAPVVPVPTPARQTPINPDAPVATRPQPLD